MDELQLKGQHLGRVFNSRSGCVRAMQLPCLETKWPNLKLKTRPKQLVGSLPLDIAFSGAWYSKLDRAFVAVHTSMLGIKWEEHLRPR